MIIIAYGANLESYYGNPVKTFQAVQNLFVDRALNIIAKSDLWDTSPVGTTEDQPSYTNAVMAIETDLTPHDLLQVLLDIEKGLGRTRSYKNAPRPVDLDLIDYDGQMIHDDSDLILPHPRMHTRKFVLVPLAQISPDWVHPISKLNVNDLIAKAPADQHIEVLS